MWFWCSIGPINQMLQSFANTAQEHQRSQAVHAWGNVKDTSSAQKNVWMQLYIFFHGFRIISLHRYDDLLEILDLWFTWFTICITPSNWSYLRASALSSAEAQAKILACNRPKPFAHACTYIVLCGGSFNMDNDGQCAAGIGAYILTCTPLSAVFGASAGFQFYIYIMLPRFWPLQSCKGNGENPEEEETRSWCCCCWGSLLMQSMSDFRILVYIYVLYGCTKPWVDAHRKLTACLKYGMGFIMGPHSALTAWDCVFYIVLCKCQRLQLLLHMEQIRYACIFKHCIDVRMDV